MRGMFRGISLNLVKNPVATAVSFAVNDFVKEAVGYGQAPPPSAVSYKCR